MKRYTDHDPQKKKARFELMIIWIDGNIWTQTAENPRVSIRKMEDQLKFLLRYAEMRSGKMRLAKLFDNAIDAKKPGHLLLQIEEGRVLFIADELQALKPSGVVIDQSKFKQYEG